jgi:hypothetical protein
MITLKQFQDRMHALNQWAQHGCSDGGCRIEPPKGPHTNGGCNCRPYAFSEHLLQLACELEAHGKHHHWPTKQI